VIIRRHDRGDLAILLLKERDAWTLPRIELGERRRDAMPTQGLPR
jgi:hypothetical protein